MHWIIIMIAAMSLGGCKKEPIPTPEDAPAAAESRPKPAPSGVKLLEEGKEPRRALRSSIAPGHEETLNIRVTSEIDALIGILHGRQAPRSVTFELTVQTKKDVLEKSRAIFFTVDEARAVHTAEVSPTVHKSRQKAVATMRGLEGSYRVDSVGLVHGVVMNLPSDASAEAWSLAEDLKWALRQLSVPFPKERIGAGAKWTVDRGVEQDGIIANEVSTLEIIKLRKQLVMIKADVRHGAKPQTFRNPGSPVDGELSEFTGEGAGEIVWNPAQLLPRLVEMTSTVTKHTTHQSEAKPLRSVIVMGRTLTINGPRH